MSREEAIFRINTCLETLPTHIIETIMMEVVAESERIKQINYCASGENEFYFTETNNALLKVPIPIINEAFSDDFVETWHKEYRAIYDKVKVKYSGNAAPFIAECEEAGGQKYNSLGTDVYSIYYIAGDE